MQHERYRTWVRGRPSDTNRSWEGRSITGCSQPSSRSSHPPRSSHNTQSCPVSSTTIWSHFLSLCVRWACLLCASHLQVTIHKSWKLLPLGYGTVWPHECQLDFCGASSWNDSLQGADPLLWSFRLLIHTRISKHFVKPGNSMLPSQKPPPPPPAGLYRKPDQRSLIN
jgi:hypothetical protein